MYCTRYNIFLQILLYQFYINSNTCKKTRTPPFFSFFSIYFFLAENTSRSGKQHLPCLLLFRLPQYGGLYFLLYTLRSSPLTFYNTGYLQSTQLELRSQPTLHPKPCTAVALQQPRATQHRHQAPLTAAPAPPFYFQQLAVVRVVQMVARVAKALVNLLFLLTFLTVRVRPLEDPGERKRVPLPTAMPSAQMLVLGHLELCHHTKMTDLRQLTFQTHLKRSLFEYEVYFLPLFLPLQHLKDSLLLLLLLNLIKTKAEFLDFLDISVVTILKLFVKWGIV